jgi:hypothetical protein
VNRRKILTDILPGSIIAFAGVTLTSWSISPGVVGAAQAAQAATVRPHGHMHSRHRRWVC